MTLELDIECGDILLFSRNCSRMPPLPAAICVSAKYSSWTVWDHVGIVVEHPETGELHLMEANIQGITVYPLLDRIKRTSSNQIAIRKLHRSMDESIDFPQLLWNTVQKYLKFEYNSSFAHMTAAAYASYTSHLSAYAKYHDKLYTLKQELDYIYAFLGHEEDVDRVASEEKPTDFASQFDNTNSGSAPSLLNRFLTKRADQLITEIESTEKIFQKLVHLRQSVQPVKPINATSSIDKAKDSNHKDRFYCSQLVAQVFMDIGVLSRIHRQAHEYVPADFSSSTMIQGLLPLNHGPDHDYHERHYHTAAATGKKPRYYFSPDYVISSPSTAVFLPKQVNFDNETKSKNNKVTVLVPDPIVASNDSPQTWVSLSLHTGDTIRSSILSQYLQSKGDTALSSTKRLVNIEIDGEVMLKPVLGSTPATRDTSVPPTVILAGKNTPSASKADAKQKSSYTTVLKKKLLESLPVQEAKEKLDIAEIDNLSDQDDMAYITQNSTTLNSTSVSLPESKETVEYDDDSVLATMRAYDHHYQSGDYELRALKASKVRFIYETPKLGSTTNDAKDFMVNHEGNDHIPVSDKHREHELKILRWKYIESLISLAWPVYHASLTIKEKENGQNKDIHSFDNDSEELTAIWQELIACLPPMEAFSPQHVLAKQRMFFAFSCFWDDSVRHLKHQECLRVKKSQNKSSSISKKTQLELENEAVVTQSQRLKATASDLADMLLHLYGQHYAAFQVSPKATHPVVSSPWQDTAQDEQQLVQRQQVIAAKIEQLLPRFVSASSASSVSFSDAKSPSSGSTFFSVSIAAMILAFSTNVPIHRPKSAYSYSDSSPSYSTATYSSVEQSCSSYLVPTIAVRPLGYLHRYRWTLSMTNGKYMRSVSNFVRRFLK